MAALIRLVHPAPTAAVVTLATALGAVLLIQAGQSALDARLILTSLAVLGSQILTGATNDWADRGRDRLVQPDKPIPAGTVSPRLALGVAASGAILQVMASLPLGPSVLLLGAAASASAAAYNLWLSRGPWSVVPYLVSFGLLPLWVAAGVAVPLERVIAAPLLVGPFAAAAHIANALRDFDADQRIGSRNLAQVLGRRPALLAAWLLAAAVGIAVGAGLWLDGRLEPISLALGVVGLIAIAQGIAGPRQLWGGMLVAAVLWTTAWALATG